jgi:hypothetical protein
MRKNISTILLLLLLLLSTTAPAWAADTPKTAEPFCGDLAKSDCELIKKSQAASLDIQSVVTNAQIEAAVSGIPEMPFKELAISISEDAVIVSDPTVIVELASLQNSKPEDLMKNMDKLMPALMKLYSTIGLDLSLTVKMPAELADALSQDAPVQIPEEITLHLKMVDGFAYVKTEDLAVFEPSITDMGDWLGIDVVGLMKKALAEAEKNQDPSQTQAMASGFAVGSMLNNEQIRTLLEDYIKIERAKDGKAGAQKTAVFNTSFDFAGFVASDALWELIAQNREALNSLSDTKVTEAELQEAKMAMTFLGPALFKDLEFAITQSIGQKDYHVYESGFTFDWDLTSVLAFAQAAQSGGKAAKRSADTPAAKVSFSAVTKNSDFNAAPAIEAPENATIIPLEALDSSMGSEETAQDDSTGSDNEAESSDDSAACKDTLTINFINEELDSYSAQLNLPDMDPVKLDCPSTEDMSSDEEIAYACSPTGIVINGAAPEEVGITLKWGKTSLTDKLLPEYESVGKCYIGSADLDLAK